jgi:glycosyltransferase involved in cell wall biosynthesis
MKIAILGTRGVPNRYGGFEQCAEYLASGLIEMNYDVTVYNCHTHPYKLNEWKGVKIVHCYDPEDKWGTVGQFVYDLNCIMHARKQSYDIILQLGYTSSSVWGRLLPKKAVITTNMDGLEWKRSKYPKPVLSFLKYAEYLATRFSDHLIADSKGIQQYLQTKYGKASTFIPYGALPFENPDPAILNAYKLSKNQYSLLIARLEPENNIETVLDGVVLSNLGETFLVIGKHETKFGKYLKNKYASHSNIKFLGSIYDISVLNNLRWFSRLYFHGHSVGGTNPSLLEAMASCALICAHDNVFNRTILEEDGSYFSSKEDVAKNIICIQKDDYQQMVHCNMHKIRNIYRWDIITRQYADHFTEICPSVKQVSHKIGLSQI